MILHEPDVSTVRPPTVPSVQVWAARSALFLVLLFAFDRALGGLFGVLLDRTRAGEGSGQVNAALDHRDVDVLYFGSSRAKQHLDPEVVRALTGLDGYNVAANGQGLPYAVGVQALLVAEGAQARCHVLHVDVVDLVAPRFDRVAVLLPHADRAPVILDLVARENPWAYVQSWSALWPYNSIALSILWNQGRPAPDGAGFTPKTTRRAGFADAREFLGASTEGAFAASPAATELLDAFVEAATAHRAGVLLVTSPLSRPGSLGPDGLTDPVRVAARAWLEGYAADHAVAYASYDEERVPALRDAALFVDDAHLGADGAALLSAFVAADVASRCR